METCWSELAPLAKDSYWKSEPCLRWRAPAHLFRGKPLVLDLKLQSLWIPHLLSS